MENSTYWIIILFGPVIMVLSIMMPPAVNAEETIPLSEETEDCIDCHIDHTPGIVADWKCSLHAQVTPEAGLKKPEAERRISSNKIPDKYQTIAVGCYECHGLNADSHPDNFDHEGYMINVVVSPNDCRTCHETEVEEFMGSKKAHAVDNLRDNPLYTQLVDSTLGVQVLEGDDLRTAAASEHTKGRTCFACHGTEVKVRGMRTIETESGDLEVPDLSNWPNQGIGRINPDGSRGACTACHTRHRFSIATARKPYTCAQCHLAPDVPAWDVFKESKHGNLFESEGHEWNWTHVPWRVGEDFRAPTCAACHMSGLATYDGYIFAERSHDFGSRLWVRIFGLPFSHPQPLSGATAGLRNSDGLSLPSDFSGHPAKAGLIDFAEARRRKELMTRVCTRCHGTDITERYFEQFEGTIKDVDAMVLTTTQLIQRAWDKGLADGKNPFDEPLEKFWVRQWLFYANSVRYSAAMSGPDYAAFKNGWWQLSENLRKLHEKVSH